MTTRSATLGSSSGDVADHATTHISTGTDAIPTAVPSGASGLLSGAWAALLNAATNAATALTLVLRDAAGRFKAASPAASDDVAIKSTVDEHSIYGTRIATLAVSGPVSFAATESKNVHTITPTNGKVTTYLIVYRAVPAVNDGSGAGVFTELFVMVRKTGGTVTLSSSIFGVNQKIAPLNVATTAAASSGATLLIQFATSGAAATLDQCDVYARES